MAKAFVCDACGQVIEHPHTQKMKEFRLDYTGEMGVVFDRPIEKNLEIHLCDDCYHALYLIATDGKQDDCQTIKVRYLSNEVERLQYIAEKNDWVDLRAAEDVEMKKGDFKMIPLGIAMQLPTGYEAHMIPRSSTFKNFGIIQANHMGMIDESYCGDNDQWYFPAIAMRDTVIHVGDRICQFRIDKHQPRLSFKAVDTLGNADRGGFGTTGKR